MEVAGYLSIILVGVTLSMIGAGGAILTVPILVYLFGIQPDAATCYSLFLVGIAAGVGAIQYSWQGLVDYKTGLLFAVPALVGVFCVRAYLMPAIPPVMQVTDAVFISKNQLILIVFSVVMMFAAFSMIKKKEMNTEVCVKTSRATRHLVIVLDGLAIGAITGFVGAGGGFIIVPALVLLTKLPMRLAVGTSLMIITIKSLLGFTGDIGHIAINWSFLIVIALVSLLGIFMGSYFARKVPANALKVGFGYFTLVMAIIIIARQFL